jgi:hypothetical protein
LAKEEFFAELAAMVFMHSTRSLRFTTEMERNRGAFRIALAHCFGDGLASEVHQAGQAQLHAFIRFAEKHKRKIDWETLYRCVWKIDRRTPTISLSELGKQLMEEEVKPVKAARFGTRPQEEDRRNNNWRIFIPRSITWLILFFTSISLIPSHRHPLRCQQAA